MDFFVSVIFIELLQAKAMTAFFSGEMKDTVQMNPITGDEETGSPVT